MADAMFSLAVTLEIVWHVVGWGLAIVLGAVLAWELVASRQRAKAVRNIQDWLSKSHTSNRSRPDASSQAPDGSQRRIRTSSAGSPRPRFIARDSESVPLSVR